MVAIKEKGVQAAGSYERLGKLYMIQGDGEREREREREKSSIPSQSMAYL